MLRLSTLALLLVLAAPASAAPRQDGGSSLDRLSETDGVLGSSSRGASTPGSSDLGPGTNCGGAGQPPCPPPDAPPVPIDGGLSLLALAGAGYAARRLRARRA